MEQLIGLEQLLDILKTQGLAVLIVFGMFIVLFYSSIAWVNHYFKIRSNPKIIIEPDSLRAHQFFSTVDMVVNVHLHNLPFSNAYKREIAITMMTAYWTRLKGSFSAIIDKDMNKKTPHEFQSQVASAIVEAVRNSQNDWVVAEVPTPAIEAVKYWRGQFEAYIFDAMMRFFGETQARSNVSKLQHVLWLLMSDLNVSQFSLLTVFEGMNGRLDGTKFRGQTYHPGQNRYVVPHVHPGAEGPNAASPQSSVQKT